MKQSAIYAIIHTASNRTYVGSAIDLKARWGCHLRKLKVGKHENPYLQRAWRKYGATAFEFRVLEVVDCPENLLEREQYWMDLLRVTKRRKGFNIAPKAGSLLGRKLTTEHRAKISASGKGKVLSEECRRKISEKAKGNKRAAGKRNRGKLTDADILEIFQLRAAKVPTVEIENKYNMPRNTIARIIARKNYPTVYIPEELVEAAQKECAHKSYGDRSPRASITSEQATQIKRALGQGMTSPDVSRALGISVHVIRQIKTQKTWNHITLK